MIPDIPVNIKAFTVFSDTKQLYIFHCFSLALLQDLIALQTEIQSSAQILIFDGQQLHDHVQPMLPIINYPAGITWKNPIFCFNRYSDEATVFPLVLLSMYM